MIRQKLLFLNGWSSPSQPWQQFLSSWFEVGQFEVIDLPLTRALNQGSERELWFAELTKRMDTQTILVGWSLGGLFAILFAAYLQRHNHRGCTSLIVMMTGPSFLKRGSWHSGLDIEPFNQFKVLLMDALVSSKNTNSVASTTQLIKQFSMFCCYRESDYRENLKYLRGAYKEAGELSGQALETGLTCLQEIDVSKELGQLAEGRRIRGEDNSICFVFADQDALVSRGAHQELIRRFPGVKARILSGSAHFPDKHALHQLKRILRAEIR